MGYGIWDMVLRFCGRVHVRFPDDDDDYYDDDLIIPRSFKKKHEINKSINECADELVIL